MAAMSPKDMLWTFAHQTREHAIVLVDPEGRISWWSPGAEEIFGIVGGRGEVDDVGGGVGMAFRELECPPATGAAAAMSAGVRRVRGILGIGRET